MVDSPEAININKIKPDVNLQMPDGSYKGVVLYTQDGAVRLERFSLVDITDGVPQVNTRAEPSLDEIVHLAINASSHEGLIKTPLHSDLLRACRGEAEKQAMEATRHKDEPNYPATRDEIQAVKDLATKLWMCGGSVQVYERAKRTKPAEAEKYNALLEQEKRGIKDIIAQWHQAHPAEKQQTPTE